MDINEVLKENPITDALKNVREISRKILNAFIYPTEQAIDKKQKELELKFFKGEIELTTKKWITEILWELETHDGLTFNALQRNIGGISSRSLSDRLKELKEIQLISREILETRPPKVLYQLTDKGKGYIELMTVVILFLKNVN